MIKMVNVDAARNIDWSMVATEPLQLVPVEFRLWRLRIAAAITIVYRLYGVT
ncbi:hypothetical protein [Bradyrhizobium sp. 23AC]